MSRKSVRTNSPDTDSRVRDVIPTITGDVARGELKQRIEATGFELRRAIAAVLEAVAGPQPRPTRVSRAIGLDKSLASRLVRVVNGIARIEASEAILAGELQLRADALGAYGSQSGASPHLDEFARRGDTYLRAKTVLYTGATQGACGFAEADYLKVLVLYRETS